MKPRSILSALVMGFMAACVALAPAWAQMAPQIPLPGATVSVSGPMDTAVNTFSGTLTYERTDFTIPDRVFTLMVRFVYNSGRSLIDDGFGYGWSFSYDTRYEADGDHLLIHYGTGEIHQFDHGPGGYISPIGVWDSLTEYEANKFQLRTRDGMEFFFDEPAHQHVTSIRDPNGNAVTFGYSPEGRLITITDSAQRVLQLSYLDSHLVSIFDSSATPKRAVQMSYDESHNLVEVKSVDGYTTSYEYDQSRLTSITDAHGNTMHVTYIPSVTGFDGHVVSEISTDLTVRSFTYNLASMTTTVTDIVDGSPRNTQYHYDARGRIIGITDALGNAVAMTWDTDNNMTDYTDHSGNMTRYEYDTRGNIVAVTDPLGNATRYAYEEQFNHITAIEDANGNATRYAYDPRGNVSQIEDPLGGVTSFLYADNGDLLEQVDANGHATLYAYNSNGDRIRTSRSCCGGVEYAYDNRGNRIRSTDGLGHATVYAYDVNDRITSISDPYGTVSHIYDPSGNVTEIIDQLGRSTTYQYDALNRLTQVSDPAGGVTAYAYDQADNLTAVTDANGHTTEFEYDGVNRLVRKIDPEGNATSYAYDPNGNIVERIDANGYATTYTYDALNRLQSVDYPHDSDATYAYDAVGNLTHMSNALVSVIKKYDALNRVTDVSTAVTAAGFDKSIGYSYDPVGNRITMVDPEGGSTQYTYDAAGRLTSLTNPAGNSITYQYDLADRVIQRSYSNGTQTYYRYDAIDQLAGIIHKDADGAVLFGRIYEYDAVGNTVRVADAAGAIDDNGNLKSITEYTYDALDRLTEVQYPEGRHVTYAYDAVGNRTSMDDTGTVTNYAYDTADRLLTAGIQTYDWDNNGNQIASTDGIHTTTIAFDDDNRITSIEDSGGDLESYTYYPNGQRLSTENDAGITYHFYDGFNDLMETDQAGSPRARYTSSLEIDDWLSMEAEGETYWYHEDNIRSTIGLTGTDAAIEASYTYDAFGALQLSQSGNSNPFQFTGRRSSRSVSLYDYRTRVYDSNTGRFTSKDKFSGFIEAPVTQHDYTYTLNNPLFERDPMGMWSLRKFVGAVLMVAGFVAAATGNPLGLVVGSLGYALYNEQEDGGVTGGKMEHGESTQPVYPDPPGATCFNSMGQRIACNTPASSYSMGRIGVQATSASLTINDIRDLIDVAVGDNYCRTSVGTCSLRAAIQETNALPGATTLYLPSGTYALTITGRGEDQCASGDLDIRDALTIIGTGAETSVVTANKIDRVFHIINAGNVVFQSLGINSGEVTEDQGGGILNQNSTVQIASSIIADNVAANGNGAGIFNQGGIVGLTNSIVTRNQSSLNGGGTNNSGGTLALSNSIISNNTAAAGGGIYNQQGNVSINNTSIAQNGGGYGDAIYQDGGNTTVVGGDISGNNWLPVDNHSGSFQVDGTLVTGNMGGFSNNGSMHIENAHITENGSAENPSWAMIRNEQSGTLLIEHSTFDKNRAAGLFIGNFGGYAEVTSSTICDNVVRSPGADWADVFHLGGPTLLRDLVIERNEALLGVVVLYNETVMQNVRIVGNQTGNKYIPAVRAGLTDGSLRIESSQISDNNGPGLSVSGGAGTLQITQSQIVGNGSVGLRLGEIDSVSIVDSIIRGNAHHGIVNDHSSTQLRNTVIEQNHVDADSGTPGGGGIRNIGGELAMWDCSILNNQVTTEGAPDPGVGLGGGILNDGTLSAENCLVAGNSAHRGGGIANIGGGTTMILNSTVSENNSGYAFSYGDGGGIYNVDSGSSVYLHRSTVAYNQSKGGGSGGGIWNTDGAFLEMINCTISGNISTNNGGGINAGHNSLINAQNVTISGNEADDLGSGLWNDLDGVVNLSNVILAGNTLPDCSISEASLVSFGHNMIGVGDPSEILAQCTFVPLASDQVGVNPLLGPLQLNAPGTTPTQALHSSSPAIDAGDPANCPTIDQRGVSRPQGAACDIGAFERMASDPTGALSSVPPISSQSGNQSPACELFLPFIVQ